jgi:hypothetical protein
VPAAVILMPVRALLPITLCLLAAGALVPEGYKTFRTAGISFVHPGDWQVAERTDADGAPAVDITPPEKGRTPYGLVRLSISPGAGDRFQSLADQRRIVIRQVNEGEIDADEAVDIPGAKEALRLSTTTPPGRGTDPVEVQSESLDVLRDNGDVVVLIAASPQRDGQELDTAAVVESLRFED